MAWHLEDTNLLFSGLCCGILESLSRGDIKSSFPDLAEVLEEKGLKKMTRAFLRGAQWPYLGIYLSPRPLGVQEVSSENELLNYEKEFPNCPGCLQNLGLSKYLEKVLLFL